MKKRTKSPVYGFARLEYNSSSGYGHINIHVYELMGYGGPTLKVSCQAGSGHGFSAQSEGEPTTYAYKHGLSNDYSVVELHGAKQGYYLLRRIQSRLHTRTEKFGNIANFADYAARVLDVADVPIVHVLEEPNGRLDIHTNVQDLPGFDPARQRDELIEVLTRMENKLLDLTRPRY